jgi:VanZ family protein
MNLRAPLLPFWVRWIAVAGLATFIFYVSIVTVPPETVIDTRPSLIPLDKWRHFIAYAALGNALAYATTDWKIDLRLMAIAVIGLTIVYGVGIEFGQSFRPNRYYSIGDAYANALGGVFVTPYYLIRPHVEFIPTLSFVRSLVE